jgi:hypothetical protein
MIEACLNEFTFRYNRRFYPFNTFRSLLGSAGDVAAPTYAGFILTNGRILAVAREGNNRIGMVQT